MSDGSQGVGDHQLLIEYVVIADGKIFHQGIESVVFLPKFAHYCPPGCAKPVYWLRPCLSIEAKNATSNLYPV